MNLGGVSSKFKIYGGLAQNPENKKFKLVSWKNNVINFFVNRTKNEENWWW